MYKFLLTALFVGVLIATAGCSSSEDTRYMQKVTITKVDNVDRVRGTYNATLTFDKEVPNEQTYIFHDGKKYAVYPATGQSSPSKTTSRIFIQHDDEKFLKSLKNKRVFILK